MNNDTIKKVNDFSEVVLDACRENYSSNSFISNKLDVIDSSNFFRLIKKKYYPPIYFFGDICFLNLNFFSKDELISVVPLSIFMFLANSFHPLKIAFIELEIAKLKDKYNWQEVIIYFEKEISLVNLLEETVLSDLNLNMLNFENDIDFINYLRDEKGSRVAIFYYNIVKKINKKYMSLPKNYSKEQFINFYNKLDYNDIVDEIYDFITKKIR